MSMESMPNELWFLFMSFLPPIDLYRAFVGLNHRIDSLLSTIKPRPILDTSQSNSHSIHFSDLRQLIEGKDDWSRYLLLSIETIRFCGTNASDILCNKNFSSQISSISTSFLHIFPSLRRVCVTEEVREKINIFDWILPISTSLRYIHLIFDAPTNSDSYFEVVNKFADHQLSFHSMKFDVKYDNINNTWIGRRYGWKKMYLSNTAHLSLCLIRLSDLFVILDTQTSPILDHLSVVLIGRNECDIQNDSQLINTMAITSRLRSLKINRMSLDNLLMFLSLVNMPLLEKLILIEIHDNTLAHLIDFQRYFQSKKNMPALHPSSLRFLFRFPGKLEYEWNNYHNLKWPFNINNIDYCLEERGLSAIEHYYSEKEKTQSKKYSLLIFTRPPLPYHRNVHNHSFSMKLKQEPSKSSIKWSFNHLTSHEELLNSLSQFTATRNFTITDWRGSKLQKAATWEVIFPSHVCHQPLDKLGSVTSLKIYFGYARLSEFQQKSFLHLLLSSVPQLVKLSIDWKFVLGTDSLFVSEYFAILPLRNLRCLHLYYRSRHKPLDSSNLIDISLLSNVFPRLVSLRTSDTKLHPDENLAKLIIALVTHLEKLTELIINKRSSYKDHSYCGVGSLVTSEEYVTNLLRNTPKLSDPNRAHIVWYNYAQLAIWL